METLSKHRQLIDNIDQQIIDLLDQRFETVKAIGKIKQQSNASVEDASREAEILRTIRSSSHNEEISQLYDLLFTLNKKVQRKLV